MPDRCLRQLGHVQGIPIAPLAQRSERGKSQTSRQARPVWYTLGEEWNTYAMRVIQAPARGRRAHVPWACTPDYEEWYASHSHPRIENPRHRRAAPVPAHVVDDAQRLGSVIALVRPLLYAADSGIRTLARSVFHAAGGIADDDDDAGPS